MRRVLRGIIDSVLEGSIKRISLKGVSGEQLIDRELFQHYGFTSRPLAGAETIVIREGNCFYAVAEDDRRYRIVIAAGEVALFDDQGQVVHLKRGKEIAVSGCDKLSAAVGVETAVTCPLVKVVAATQIELTTPLVTVSGALAATAITATGALVGSVSVSDPAGTMQQMRDAYNGHTHPSGGIPAPQM